MHNKASINPNGVNQQPCVTHHAAHSASAVSTSRIAGDGNCSRNTRLRIPVGEHAELHVRRSRSLSIFCLIQCVPFFLAWMISVADLCLTLSVSGQKASRVKVAFHDGWYFEAILLLMEAGFATLIMCVSGGIIASRFMVSPTFHTFTSTSICALIGSNLGWIIHEYYRGHVPIFKFWTVCEIQHLLTDLKTAFTNHHRLIPQWMKSMQMNVHCCGVRSYEDWKLYFGLTSLPDSCCENPVEGCGENYFRLDEMNRPSIYEQGCAKINSTGMNYKTFYFLLSVKTIETFLFMITLIVWLFCFRREYLEVQVRRRRQRLSNQNPSIPTTSLSTDPNNNILQAQKIFTVNSNAQNQERNKTADQKPLPKPFKERDASHWKPLSPAVPDVPQFIA